MSPLCLDSTVKPVLSGHSKIDKTKILKTGGSLFQDKSIAECSTGAFCNTFDLHLAIISLENIFLGLFCVAALDRFYCSWCSNTLYMYVNR